MPLSVGDLARLTGVTVRALHHYDEIGLCKPSARTRAGYRQYTDADVLRLQQILLLRELGMPLTEIAEALERGSTRDMLRKHRSTLVEKRARLDTMIAALDVALDRQEKGIAMKPDEMKQLFDGFDPSEHEDEARERWGNTDAYKESHRRTRGYTKADWERMGEEMNAINQELLAQMRAAAPADAPAVQALVERHRLHIDRWFYPCSVEMHAGLGEMYVADPRFTANLDKVAPGFARYLRDAIVASAARAV
jgi:DNA-binding transcriptional MerR regulator